MKRFVILVIAAATLAVAALIFVQPAPPSPPLTPPPSLQDGQRQRPSQEPLSEDPTNWLTYRNDRMGYEVRYPPSRQVVERSDITEFVPQREGTRYTFDVAVYEERNFDDFKSTVLTGQPVLDFRNDGLSGIRVWDTVYIPSGTRLYAISIVRLGTDPPDVPDFEYFVRTFRLLR